MKCSVIKMIRVITIVITLLGAAVIAHAVPIMPISYDMQNGNGTASHEGEYNYLDVNYSGVGASSGTGLKVVEGEYLTGGLGKLTDGKIAEKSWEWYEPFSEGDISYNYRTLENIQGTGLYVGWTINPIITFHFDNQVDIDNITFYVDNPENDFEGSNPHGGVAAPISFTINGEFDYKSGFDTSIDNKEGAGPVAIKINISDLGLDNINDLTVEINRDIYGGNRFWLFVSEIKFDDGMPTPVPEPSTFILFGAGIAGVALLRNRRKK